MKRRTSPIYVTRCISRPDCLPQHERKGEKHVGKAPHGKCLTVPWVTWTSFRDGSDELVLNGVSGTLRVTIRGSRWFLWCTSPDSPHH
jgi:hypothetical protein